MKFGLNFKSCRMRRYAAFWLTLAAALEEGLEGYVGMARYALFVERCDQRNGHYLRDLVTTARLSSI